MMDNVPKAVTPFNKAKDKQPLQVTVSMIDLPLKDFIPTKKFKSLAGKNEPR